MIDRINVLNVVTNKSIEISKTGSPFVLDEIDWDTPSVTMETYRVPNQVGETLAGVMVGTRKPTITGYVVANIDQGSMLGMSWSEYYELQEQSIEESKIELDRIFSIYRDVVIEANGFYLDARPTQPPKYSTDEKENNEVLCYFTVELECYKPMFYSENRIVDLATTNAMFHFPLVIPPEKVVFGEVMQRRSVLIENDGDMDVGCVITIRCVAGIVNDPRVYNVNSGEFIEFRGVTLEDGDYITITTEIGEENAIKRDVSESKDISVVGYILEDSQFLKIKQGQDMYAYSVDESEVNNVEVSISFMPRYINIRGM